VYINQGKDIKGKITKKYKKTSLGNRGGKRSFRTRNAGSSGSLNTIVRE